MHTDIKKRLMKFFEENANSNDRFLLPYEYDCALACRRDGCCSFGIPCSVYQDFYEKFNSCILETGLENNHPYLYLSCKELSEEFIDFCLTSFVPIEKRKEITSDPAEWFEKISSIFGNSVSATATSDKIAELYVFLQMKCYGIHNISFGGYNKKNLRDIQCEGFEVEVKSTLHHHTWPIHTNAEQIGKKTGSDKPCFFVLCRLEQSEALVGESCYSLNSLKRELSGYSGCDDMLSKLPKSTTLLNQTYIIRDIKVFSVDENFPSVKLTGIAGGAVLKNFVLELNPDVLNAVTLEEFLLAQGGVEPEEVQTATDNSTQDETAEIAVETTADTATARVTVPRGKETILDAAIKILELRKCPMNAKEITEALKEYNPSLFKPTAKTPENTVSSILRTYINGKENRYIKMPERGKFEYITEESAKDNTFPSRQIENNADANPIKEFLIKTYGENVVNLSHDTTVGLLVYDERKDSFGIYLPFAQNKASNFIEITRNLRVKSNVAPVTWENVRNMKIAVRDSEDNYLLTAWERPLSDFLSSDLIIMDCGFLSFDELENQDRFLLEWALLGVDSDTDNIVCPKDFSELKYFCDNPLPNEMETECITQVSSDCTEEIGFASFKVFLFDRNFKERKIKRLVVPGKIWDYTSPVSGKDAFHDFLAWYWDNHQDILVEKAKCEDRYAESERELRECYKTPDCYKISETCHINQRFSLTDTCNEMQKLLKEAYGDELDETSGIFWVKK